MSYPLIEPLSPRDNDILVLLGQDLSNREIAERLVLSLHTVKWYTQQVYRKLEVANRQEAVAKARELGLLATKEALTKIPSSSLPRQLTSFIGREKEINEVVGMVGEHPLVTLIGSGGVGKTRLAQMVAGELMGRFANGIWYIELASLADPQLLAHTIASLVGIREEVERSLLASIISYFNNRQALLILDNFEHLVAGCAELVQALLEALPGLKVLVTSRQPLGVSGEVIFYVPSLTYPDDLTVNGVEDCLAFESVRLFVERARTGLSGFQLTLENAAPVIQICRRLDGVPLAIELAAAKTRLMSVEEIAARLDNAFGLLTGGSRTALPRHQTLHALIGWSYDLLSTEEQALLLRLSVFAGVWTLEAAEQVCSDPGSKGISAASAAEQVCSDDGGENGSPVQQTQQIVDLLGQLIDKSLVQFDPSLKDRPHYYFLETVRQFASERLAECGAEFGVRERHLDYYLALAERAEPHLRAEGSKYWLDRLGHELDNFRNALEWSFARSQGSSSQSLEIGLRLSTALGWFWTMRNHHTEGIDWLERLLLRQESQGDLQNLAVESKVARGRALNVLSLIINGPRGPDVLPRLRLSREVINKESETIFQELGDAYLRDYALSLLNQAETTQDYFECRELFLTVKDLFWVAQCDTELFFHLLPDFDSAFFYAEEVLELTKEIGDMDGEGGGFFMSCLIAYYRGDLDRAVELINHSIDCLEKAGDGEYAAYFRGNLATFYTQRGNYQEATKHIEIVRAAAQELNIKALEYDYLRCQAYLAWVKKEYDLATHYCEKALEFGELYINWWLFSFTPIYILTRMEITQGKLALARSYLRDVLKIANGAPTVLARVFAIYVLGIYAVKQGLMYEAVILFGAQDAQWKWINNTLTPIELSEYNQALADAQAVLGEEAFSVDWEAGRAMSFEEVFAYALTVVDGEKSI